MSRLFDGVDDQMTFPVSGALNDAMTLLIVCRIMVTADNTWLSLVEGERTGGTSIGCALGRRNDGVIYFANSNGTAVGATAITDSDGWQIIAVTRSSAAATTVHKIPIGGTRTTDTGGALADGLTMASGEFRIGGDDDFANIRVAAMAWWDGVALTTTQLDGINTAKTTQSIADLSPTALYDDSDAFAADLIGSQDRSAITGTADDADDPSGWVYGLGGGPTAYEIDAAPGSFTITGVAATIPRSRLFDAQPGSFTITGVAATTARSRFISADPGSYAITGVQADLVYVPVGQAYELDCQPGSYVITGTAATTARGYFLSVDPGSYAVTGVSTTHFRTYITVASPGSYVLTGFPTGLSIPERGAQLTDHSPTSLTLVDHSADALTLVDATPDTVTLTGV